jgi:hypothetical protein
LALQLHDGWRHAFAGEAVERPARVSTDDKFLLRQTAQVSAREFVIARCAGTIFGKEC